MCAYCEWIIRDSACLCVVSGRGVGEGEGNGLGRLLYGELFNSVQLWDALEIYGFVSAEVVGSLLAVKHYC